MTQGRAAAIMRTWDRSVSVSRARRSWLKDRCYHISHRCLPRDKASRREEKWREEDDLLRSRERKKTKKIQTGRRRTFPKRRSDLPSDSRVWVGLNGSGMGCDAGVSHLCLDRCLDYCQPTTIEPRITAMISLRPNTA